MLIKNLKAKVPLGVQVKQTIKDSIIKIADKTSLFKLGNVAYITIDDFNQLLAGKQVEGYQNNKNTFYKIVSKAPDKKFALQRIKVNPNITEVFNSTILDNVTESLKENVETSNTFTNIETPQVNIRYYQTEVKPGEDVYIQYYVDTKHAKRLLENKIQDTFTTIIRDANDNILAKYTTYAGEFKVKIKFTEELGQTWFTIQTIDNHGVGSAVQFFDILVRNPIVSRIYEMKASDLAKYSIQPNIEDKLIGYKNKIGLSKLFADAKTNGYTEVKLYNPSGDTIYYIDYHKNISNKTGVYDFGSPTFYLYKLQSGKIAENITLTPGKRITVNSKNYTVGTDVLSWIEEDGAKIYRDKNDKIKVFWKGNWFNSVKQVTVSEDYLRTYRLAYFTETLSETLDNGDKVTYKRYEKYPDGYYYIVSSTVPYTSSKGYSGGDFMKLPYSFTLDLNGSTLHAVNCNDIRVEGSIIKFYDNFDSHVKNGKAVGMYKNYNFPRTFILTSQSSAGTPVEHINVVSMAGSRYCSVENVDISYSTGYESGVGGLGVGTQGTLNSWDNTSKYDPINPYTCKYPTVRFNKAGYINYEGELVQPEAICPLASNSPDLSKGDSIGIVHTSNFIACNPRYTGKNGEIIYTKEISIEPSGYKQYMAGKQHEVFVHFYDSSYQFIKTVKTHMYMLIKIPSQTAYVKISGYGVCQGNQPVLDKGGRCVAFEHIALVSRGTFSKNTVYRNCSYHDTRTIAFSMSYAKGHLWDNCTYVRIAVEPRNDWFVTKIFGDFEEGWESTDLATVRECFAERGFSEETGDQGQRTIAINCCRNFTFYNNSGIGIEERGGIESALYYRSNIPVLRISRSGKYERPICIYRELKVPDELKVSYSNDSITRIYTAVNYRYNRCDDNVEDKLTIMTSETPTIQYGTGGRQLKVNFKETEMQQSDRY